MTATIAVKLKQKRYDIVCDAMLWMSCVIAWPFWWVTIAHLQAGHVLPGTAAFFTGGVTLLFVNLFFQIREVKARPTWRAWVILAFFGVMIIGNVVADVVIFTTGLWTGFDTVCLVVAGALLPLCYWGLRRFQLGRRVTMMVALPVSGKVVMQCLMAVEALAIKSSTPLSMIVFFFVFGVSRLSALSRQYIRNRTVGNKAMLITEASNLVSIGVLFVVWLITIA